MRVIYIEYGIGFGGSVVSLAELANALRLSGVVTPIVVTTQEGDTLAELFNHIEHVYFARPVSYRTRFSFDGWVKKLSAPRYLKWCLSKLYALLDLTFEYVNSLRLFMLIRQHKAELVHVNNSWVDEAVRAAHWAGVPCVLHYRGFVEAGDVSGSATRRNWLDKTVRHAIAISHSVAQSIVASGLPASMVTTIYNPIRLERYEAGRAMRSPIRAAHGFDDHEVVVAIFGRITEWKGQLEFLQSVAAIIDRCPDMRVLIVGDQSDGYGSSYSQAILDLVATRLASIVVFSGYQNRVQDYYWASDIVIHNSQEMEPFGRVVSEAMACERAVIAMDEGGPAEIITSGTDGLLVAPRSAEALSRAMLELYENPGRRRELGRCARLTIERRFTDTQIAGQVLDIYRSVQ